MWGKKPAKQLFQEHTNSVNKKCWEKIVGKKCEKRFLYLHIISCPKNVGEKTRETIFPETH